jgi:hypothetical protein
MTSETKEFLRSAGIILVILFTAWAVLYVMARAHILFFISIIALFLWREYRAADAKDTLHFYKMEMCGDCRRKLIAEKERLVIERIITEEEEQHRRFHDMKKKGEDKKWEIKK